MTFVSEGAQQAGIGDALGLAKQTLAVRNTRAIGKADMVLNIELGHFELFAGQTVYQGNTDVSLKVNDMNDSGRQVWSKALGEVLYPTHGPIAVQEKREGQFQREFVNVVATEIGKRFYKHAPHENFAIDALANK